MTDVDLIRTQLNAATADLAAVRSRRTILEAELNDLALQETELTAKAATLRAEIKRLEVRPQDLERFSRLTETLHAKLATAPHNSPTVRRVRSSLERLSDERVPVSSRLSLAGGLLDDLQRHHQLDREVWDGAEGRNAAHRDR